MPRVLRNARNARPRALAREGGLLPIDEEHKAELIKEAQTYADLVKFTYELVCSEIEGDIYDTMSAVSIMVARRLQVPAKPEPSDATTAPPAEPVRCTGCGSSDPIVPCCPEKRMLTIDQLLRRANAFEAQLRLSRIIPDPAFNDYEVPPPTDHSS